MKNWKKWIFEDTDGSFSVRKVLALIAGALFAYAVIYWKIANDGKELPASYLGVIAGVFGFYFLKNALSNITIGNKK